MYTSGVLPRVGISACLLGHEVRYDGGHKRADYLTELAGRVAWIPVCPEQGAGFGVPREPVELVGERMVATTTRRDVSDALLAFAGPELDRLAALDVRGFVFKSRSPSCDLHGIRGLFARAFVARFPALPVADEVELADPARRAAFLALL